MNENISAKKINVEGMELLGKGQAGEVYADGDKVIKLYFYPKTPMERAYYYYAISQHFMKENLPVAKSYDFVEADGRFGIIYERIKGEILPDYFKGGFDEKKKCAAYMGKLMRQLHMANVMDTLSPYEEGPVMGALRMVRVIPEENLQALIDNIKALPGPRVMVHGDAHEGNFMMRNDGPVMIDLDTVTIGHPIFDISYWLFLKEGTPSETRRNRIGITEEQVEEYLYTAYENYFETTDRTIIDKYIEVMNYAHDFYMALDGFKRFKFKEDKSGVVEYANESYPKALEALKKLSEHVEEIDFSFIK